MTKHDFAKNYCRVVSDLSGDCDSLPGEYIVEGICYATDHPQEPKPSYPEEEGVLSSLFAAMDFPLSFLDLPSIYLNMVPIVIYKTIG